MELESLDNLHGRADFFGSDRRKEYKLLHQKMKVLQTWIFIQSFVMALLIAYLIVLSVWLAPLFPMNYDTEEDTDSNTAEIRSLQNKYSSSEEQVDNNTDSINELQDWRNNHTNDDDELNSKIMTQGEEINDLYNITDKLNASVVLLRLEVASLAVLTTNQRDRIDNLEGRVGVLEEQQRRLLLTTVPELRKMNTRLDHDDVRLTKLECSQGALSDSVNASEGKTKEKLCNMTKTIGDVIGNVTKIQVNGKKYYERAKSIYKAIDGNITLMNQSIHEIREQQDSFENVQGEIKTNMTDLEERLGKRIQGLRNITAGIADTLDQSINKSQNHVYWALDTFREQDALREATAEDARIKLNGGLTKLQCSLDILNQTLFEKIDDEKDNFHEWVSQSINLTQRMISASADTLQNRLTETKENITGRLQDTKHSLENLLSNVSSDLSVEADDREQQYVHLCDQIHGLNKLLSEENAAQDTHIQNNKKHINNLNDSIDSLDERQTDFSGQLTDIKEDITKQKTASMFHRRSTTASLIQLRNETCDMQQQLDNITSEQGKIENRMTNAEQRATAVKSELKQDILSAEGEFLMAIASLNNDHLEATTRVQRTEETIAEIVNGLGGDITSISPPIVTTLPRLRDSIIETVPSEEYLSDYGNGDYGDHE